MKTFLLIAVSTLAMRAQAPAPTARLNGRYHFVQMAIVGSETGQPIQTQNIGGDILFDGAGAYRLSARRGVGAGAATSFDATGTYTVSPGGLIALTNPADASTQLNARLGADGAVLIGSANEPGTYLRDMFVGVRAAEWQDGAPETHLSGRYAGASLLLPDGTIDALSTAFFEMNADGAGRLLSVIASGQASNNKNLTVRQAIADAKYSLRPDGAGSAAFTDSGVLLSGSREIFVSPDGEVLLGFSPDTGRREILLAVRWPSSAFPDSWKGNWSVNELLVDNEIAGAARLESSLGSLEADGTGHVRLAQRLTAGGPWRDVTAINYAAQGDDGGAQLGSFLEDGRSNLALGSTAFVCAEVGAVDSFHRIHGLMFGVRTFAAPALEVRNAASLAPGIGPIAPGELITLRAGGIAKGTTVAPAGPPTYDLNGVRVTINGIASALLALGTDWINLQAPANLEGDSAEIVVRTGEPVSRVVTVPLSATSPGIFSQDGSGTGIAVALHGDGSLVSADAPAAPGESLTVLATGLGTSNLTRVWAFGGIDRAAVLSIDAAIGVPGTYRVTITVPPGAPGSNLMAVGLGTATAFTSMVDIPVR